MLIKEDKNDKNSTVPVCKIRLNDIFQLLHVTAKNESETSNIEIFNTAFIDDNNKIVFTGEAGEHCIIAKTKNENNPIEKTAAFEVISNYVEKFLGPDLKKLLDIKDLHSVPDELPDAAAMVSNDRTNVNEIKTFKSFLNQSKYLLSEEASGEEASSEDESGEEIPEEYEEETIDEDVSDIYFIIYTLKIDGYKQNRLAQNLGKLPGKFPKFIIKIIDGFGVEFGSMWGGRSGEVHTVADFKKGLGNLVGKFDETSYLQAYETNLKRIYNDYDLYRFSIKILPISDIKSIYKDQLTVNDIQLLDDQGVFKAKKAVCTYFTYINDAVKNNVSRKNIAKIMNKSMNNFFKKRIKLYRIKPTDIVVLNKKTVVTETGDTIVSLMDKLFENFDFQKYIQLMNEVLSPDEQKVIDDITNYLKNDHNFINNFDVKIRIDDDIFKHKELKTDITVNGKNFSKHTQITKDLCIKIFTELINNKTNTALYDTLLQSIPIEVLKDILTKMYYKKDIDKDIDKDIHDYVKLYIVPMRGIADKRPDEVGGDYKGD